MKVVGQTTVSLLTPPLTLKGTTFTGVEGVGKRRSVSRKYVPSCFLRLFQVAADTSVVVCYFLFSF